MFKLGKIGWTAFLIAGFWLLGDDGETVNNTETQLVKVAEPLSSLMTTDPLADLKFEADRPQNSQLANKKRSSVKQPDQVARSDTRVSPQSKPSSTLDRSTQPAPAKRRSQEQSAVPITMYVDASRLNVRNAPGKQGKIIWTLKRDEAVNVVAQSGEWLGLKSQRYSGWVIGTYLTKKPSPKVVRKTPTQPTISVAAVKRLLIKRSHAYYSGNCPCPYNRTSKGHKCGKRSAYSKPGGAEPLCYARDVTTAMV